MTPVSPGGLEAAARRKGGNPASLTVVIATPTRLRDHTMMDPQDPRYHGAPKEPYEPGEEDDDTEENDDEEESDDDEEAESTPEEADNQRVYDAAIAALRGESR